jgi:hypothetical protein
MRAAVLAAGVLFPLAALAQSDARADRDYCLALSDTYVRYIGFDTGSSRNLIGRGSLDAQVAVGKCKQGQDLDWAIRVLEQQLRSGGFTLPRRR